MFSAIQEFALLIMFYSMSVCKSCMVRSWELLNLVRTLYVYRKFQLNMENIYGA